MEPKVQRKRGPRKEFDQRVSLYENQEGIDLLEQLAERRKTTLTETLRELIREEAQRIGVQPG